MGSMGWHSSRMSYYKLRIMSAFNYRIIHVRRISLTPNPSAHDRIRIIHIRMDPDRIGCPITNSSPNSHNSDPDRIGCGYYPHHFHPQLAAHI
jgi:hypothetical protein